MHSALVRVEIMVLLRCCVDRVSVSNAVCIVNVFLIEKAAIENKQEQPLSD